MTSSWDLCSCLCGFFQVSWYSVFARRKSTLMDVTMDISTDCIVHSLTILMLPRTVSKKRCRRLTGITCKSH